MPSRAFSSFSLQELKSLATSSDDVDWLNELLAHVRDIRRTRAARAFQTELEARLSRGSQTNAPAPSQPTLGPEFDAPPPGAPRRRQRVHPPPHPPTEEQQAAREAFMRGGSLKIAAFAGAGKTSTLKLMANEREGLGLYLAFNRKIARDARGDFPEQVDCRTTHSLAARSIRSTHNLSRDKMFGHMGAMQLASALELKPRRIEEKVSLTPTQQAFLLLATVRRFCQGADECIGLAHVHSTPRLLGLSASALEDTQRWVHDQACGLWKRMIDARDEMPLGHDGYLKLWALQRPRLHHEYILLDEAQDTNAVVLGVLTAQTSQMVYVGDRHQQIYEWRGAVNAMGAIGTRETATLTQSFRFGAAIAAEANKVLRALGEPLPLRGSERINSVIAAEGEADAILARTNATVIAETLAAIERGRRPYIVGGTDELRRLVGDVFNLMRAEPAAHPDFFGFKNWDEVVAFAGTEEGESLQAFVQLVQSNGAGRLWSAIVKSAPTQEQSDLSVSTAHKAKGAEWSSVRLANDFLAENQKPPEISKAEARLFYVAMTRAKQQLIVEPTLLAAYTNARSFTAVANVRRGRTRNTTDEQSPMGAPSSSGPAQTGEWPEGMF